MHRRRPKTKQTGSGFVIFKRSPESPHDPSHGTGMVVRSSGGSNTQVSIGRRKTIDPICLVFYANWCPHCVKFSTIFHEAKMISETKKFVMIRIDNDKNGEISARYVPDGKYIPRVFFLSSAGQLDPQIQAPRKEYKYFYDERSPSPATARGSFSSSMDKALKKLR